MSGKKKNTPSKVEDNLYGGGKVESWLKQMAVQLGGLYIILLAIGFFVKRTDHGFMGEIFDRIPAGAVVISVLGLLYGMAMMTGMSRDKQVQYNQLIAVLTFVYCAAFTFQSIGQNKTQGIYDVFVPEVNFATGQPTVMQPYSTALSRPVAPPPVYPPAYAAPPAYAPPQVYAPPAAPVPRIIETTTAPVAAPAPVPTGFKYF